MLSVPISAIPKNSFRIIGLINFKLIFSIGWNDLPSSSFVFAYLCILKSWKYVKIILFKIFVNRNKFFPAWQNKAGSSKLNLCCIQHFKGSKMFHLIYIYINVFFRLRNILKLAGTRSHSRTITKCLLWNLASEPTRFCIAVFCIGGFVLFDSAALFGSIHQVSNSLTG